MMYIQKGIAKVAKSTELARVAGKLNYRRRYESIALSTSMRDKPHEHYKIIDLDGNLVKATKQSLIDNRYLKKLE